MNLRHYKIRIILFSSVLLATLFAVFTTYMINKSTINTLKNNIAKKIYQLRENELFNHRKNLKGFLKKISRNKNSVVMVISNRIPQGYKIKQNRVYSTFDFGSKSIVIIDDITDEIKPLKELAKVNLIIVSIISFVFFMILTLFILFLLRRFKIVRGIIANIHKRRFDQLPPVTEEKNICDEFRNELVKLGMEIQNYIKALSMEVEGYKKKAYLDELTSAFNRNFFKEKKNELFIKASVSASPTAVIMLDIDEFKKINDTYGHAVGDMILVKLAQTIRSIIRKDDLFIRYGGEEFLIILPNSNVKNAYKIAQKIRKAVENLEVLVDGEKIKFTVSLGVSGVEEDDESMYDSIKRADENLYKAKRGGKNRVEA